MLWGGGTAESAPAHQGSVMANVVHLEAQSKSWPELKALLWLLAAGAAGAFCAFLPAAHLLFRI
jgi:hypothetical protein